MKAGRDTIAANSVQNAAPAMLAALREQWRVLNAQPKPSDAEMLAAARQVQAAIAKAEGR